MNDPIKAALDAAAKRLCVCDGECFETRHGMMNGPCEGMLKQTSAAVAAFLRALPVAEGQLFHHVLLSRRTVKGLADAVERAACVSD